MTSTRFLQIRQHFLFRLDLGAVEIGSKADAVLTNVFENVLEVLDHQFSGCVCIPATVWAEEASSEVDADNACGSPIAANCLSVRFRECGLKACALECVATRGASLIAATSRTPFIEVRQIDQNSQPIAGVNQLLPRSVRPGPVSGEEGQRNGTPCPNAFDRLQTDRESEVPPHYSTPEVRNSGRLIPRLRYEEQVPTRRLPSLVDIIDIAADANAPATPSQYGEEETPC